MLFQCKISRMILKLLLKRRKAKKINVILKNNKIVELSLLVQ